MAAGLVHIWECRGDQNLVLPQGGNKADLNPFTPRTSEGSMSDEQALKRENVTMIVYLYQVGSQSTYAEVLMRK